MNKFWLKIRLIFADTTLRRRVLFTGLALILFRFTAAIPIPGVNTNQLNNLLSGNQFLGLLNIFSGGGLSNLSIVMLGVGPFITASIIMQLLTIMFPSLKEMYQESGEAGRRKFTQYSRIITVPLAALQGLALISLLTSQGVIGVLPLSQKIVNLVVVVAGAILLMWLGELISEFGIGNGTSLLIFAGIVSQIPSSVAQIIATFSASDIPIYLGFLVAAVIVVAGVVVVTEAERPIPVTYAKQVRGNKLYGGTSTYLPIRLNQAGVMPIIFALSILLFPQMIANFFSTSSIAILSTVSSFMLTLLNNSWLYAIAYFLLVLMFTYFYSAITFDPEAISENLQKSGAFIPGIRPGRPTNEHISKIVTRLTLVGAVFLGVIAMLPLAMRAVTGITALAIGGTGLLIVVSTTLDLVKQINSQLTLREY